METKVQVRHSMHGTEYLEPYVVVSIGKKWITLRRAATLTGASKFISKIRERFLRIDGRQGDFANAVYPRFIVKGDLDRLNALADANGGTWKLGEGGK